MASSTAQLHVPCYPGTGRPILVPSSVNTFALPTMLFFALNASSFPQFIVPVLLAIPSEDPHCRGFSSTLDQALVSFGPGFSFGLHFNSGASCILWGGDKPFAYQRPEIVDAYVSNKGAVGRVTAPFLFPLVSGLLVDGFVVMPEGGQTGGSSCSVHVLFYWCLCLWAVSLGFPANVVVGRGPDGQAWYWVHMSQDCCLPL